MNTYERLHCIDNVIKVIEVISVMTRLFFRIDFGLFECFPFRPQFLNCSVIKFIRVDELF